MNNNKTNTISAYVALQTNYADQISEEDRTEIARRFAEPFDPVDDAEVAAFLKTMAIPTLLDSVQGAKPWRRGMVGAAPPPGRPTRQHPAVPNGTTGCRSAPR